RPRGPPRGAGSATAGAAARSRHGAPLGAAHIPLPAGEAMNARIVGGLAAIALAAAGYGLYTLGMSRGMAMPSSPAVSGAPPEDRQVLYWHDPMVPGQRFDKPGKSPYMDMDLVPVYAGEGTDEG